MEQCLARHPGDRRSVLRNASEPFAARSGTMQSKPRFIETVPKHGYRFIAALPSQASASARASTSNVAGACTIAGLAAGALAGLLYGTVAGTGGGGQVLILAAMIGALGLLAGAGLGAGMAAAMLWRGRADGWVVVGTALGGLAVGALGNQLDERAWGYFREWP